MSALLFVFLLAADYSRICFPWQMTSERLT
jgi:hypothetical protein